MLNLIQHLIESICYETLKRVQGGKELVGRGDFSRPSVEL